MRPNNFKSDFIVVLTFRERILQNDGSYAFKDIGVPQYDWAAKFSVWPSPTIYEASSLGGTMTNCVIHNDRVLVLFKNHNLSPGKLDVELTTFIPDSLFPDGLRKTVEPLISPVRLVSGPGATPSAAEIEAVLPYIRADVPAFPLLEIITDAGTYKITSHGVEFEAAATDGYDSYYGYYDGVVYNIGEWDL